MAWYGLLLNDMRQPNIENLQVVRVSEDPEDLEHCYLRQLATAPWQDVQVTPRGRRVWDKVFLQGSELEWFNPVADIRARGAFEGGIWKWTGDGLPPVGLAIMKGSW